MILGSSPTLPHASHPARPGPARPDRAAALAGSTRQLLRGTFRPNPAPCSAKGTAKDPFQLSNPRFSSSSNSSTSSSSSVTRVLQPLRAASLEQGVTAPLPPRPQGPTDTVLELWQAADAVVFDVDSTITRDDTLDSLGKFMGLKDEVLRHEAMDGTMNLPDTMAERLAIMNCSPEDIQQFLLEHPPKERLVPGVEELVSALRTRGKEVFLTGGFREVVLPIAEHLGIPAKNVFANSMSWELDDKGQPVRLKEFDMTHPATHSQGKPQALARIRRQYPYNNVVMIGDGISDLEAVNTTGGADLFIHYGGVAEHPQVASRSDWFVRSFDELMRCLKRYKVVMIGSGAWACAAVRMVAQSTAEASRSPASSFVKDVTMWVHEEKHSGRNLTEYINEHHDNPIYLPGVSLGENVVANNNLIDAARDADLLIFCAPHQFMHGICKQLAAARVVKRDAKAISLTKGMRVRAEGPQLISQMISRILGIDCSVLMGANIAADIGREELSEAVVAYSSRDAGILWQQLFQRPYFAINLLPDVPGAEISGTLKNIVAVGAGIGDGLGIGSNSKATILRQGLSEMRKFCKNLYPSVRDDTFFESCGVADVIASSYGGRNRRVSEAWCKRRMSGDTQITFDDLEREMLNGQKLQGVLTSDEVQEILIERGWELDFPLFTTIHRIIHGEVSPDMILRFREAVSMKSLK
uniref:Glycerol-3-phosphate dehydrogenase [NAD(+)] n=1 Tax=Dunaliella viridis TaxID=140095 RepID=C5H3W0_9CHLO|nr:glycerol-3-phosphate dehydrogenase [Dunaliella viridis]